MIDAKHALSVLLNLTRSLTEGQALEETLQVVTDAALALLPANHASVRLFDDTRTELLCWARSGAGTDHRPLTFEPGEGVSGWVAENGRVVRIDETHSDTRWVPRDDQGFAVRSMIAIPLWSAGNVIGVLNVSSGQPGAFAPADEVLARLLANSAIPHIERARLARLAVTDPVTMAFNQQYLFPRLREEIARAERYGRELTVLLCALDGFDLEAESGEGDEGQLRAFADRVKSKVRRPDILIRRGATDFMLVMPATNGQDGAMVAERIRSAQAHGVTDETDLARHTVSIGVATWDGRESAEHLEYRADNALSAARAAGQDTIHVAPDA